MNQDLITEIRNKVDIVDIISERIPLVAKGKNFFGVCPFHEDTNPSMSVSREKQIFRCFSCGASGNVFTFLMDYDHKSFKEVLKDLGSRVGVNTSSISVNNVSTKYDKLYEAYNISEKYYQNNLNSKEGRLAREYLYKRKLDEEVIKEFGVGLSLDNRDNLVKLLQNKKYDLATLNQIGLAIDDHDTYMNRIMFPLHDTYGKIVGFSGRIYKTEDKSNGKYVNTKETIIFKKGSCLYHYHIAKDVCRTTKSVIVMEGFMDVIRASTIGIRNTVALMGTALTTEQIKLLKRLSNNIILCLDGDNPGREAALKNGKLLLDEGLEVKIALLPNPDDPDTYIINNGKEKFISLISSAVNYSDYKIEKLKENVNFNSEEDLSKYINNVLEETVKIDDEIRVEIILKKLAKDYNIGYNTLEKRFNALKAEKPLKETVKVEIKHPRNKRKDKYIQAMEQIIYFMVNNNDWVIESVANENIIYPTNNERLLTSEIIYYYKKNRGFSLADFYTYLQDKPDLLNFLNEIINSNYIEKVEKKDLFTYFKVLKDYSKTKQIERLEEKLKKENNPDIQAEIAEQIRKLKLGE